MGEIYFETKTTSANVKKVAFLLLLFFDLYQSYAQNPALIKKEKIEEFRILFVQNVQLQNHRLSKYKDINFKIDTCFINIETIDYENSMDENIVIFIPTLGAVIHENGEISYKTKAIKEVLENKMSKQIITHFYSSSNEIGLFLKFENQEKYKEIQERIKELSGFCTLE